MWSIRHIGCQLADLVFRSEKMGHPIWSGNFIIAVALMFTLTTHAAAQKR